MGANVFQYPGYGFYVGYFNEHSAGFTAPAWPGYPVTNLGDDVPHIRVDQPLGTALANGANRDFGVVRVDSPGDATWTFTIRNMGYAPLSSFEVTEDGADPADFSVSVSGLPTSIAPGGSGE